MTGRIIEKQYLPAQEAGYMTIAALPGMPMMPVTEKVSEKWRFIIEGVGDGMMARQILEVDEETYSFFRMGDSCNVERVSSSSAPLVFCTRID